MPAMRITPLTAAMPGRLLHLQEPQPEPGRLRAGDQQGDPGPSRHGGRRPPGGAVRHPGGGGSRVQAHSALCSRGERRQRAPAQLQEPLFQAAEQACREVYGPERPILFGNTTSSNDTRFLQEVNPKSETLTFVPVVFTEHGAHGPDEVVTVDSLVSGVEWTAELMQRLGEAKE